MRFNCGDPEKSKWLILSNWHTWCAWRPVIMMTKDGMKSCVWLEKIHRKGTEITRLSDESFKKTRWTWEYKE